MAITPFVPDSVVLADLAACLKVWDGEIVAPPDAPFWTQIVQNQHSSATDLIYLRLITRGYTQEQIALWDLGSEVERQVALYLCLSAGGALEAADVKLLADYKMYVDPDPAKSWFAQVLITIDGIPKDPNDVHGTARGGANYPAPCTSGWNQGDFGWSW